MTNLLTLVVAVLVFGVLVLVHELGHFLAARRCGIRVEEFSIGFGPALFSREKHGTRFTLRLIPLGGYNLMTAPPQEDEDDAPRKPAPRPTCHGASVMDGLDFEEAGPWQRFFVIAAGALMNFAAGFVILVVLVCGQEVLTSRIIYDFTDDAVSSRCGLREEDEILAVNGSPCFIMEDVMYELQRAQRQTADFTVLREGRIVQVPQVSFGTAVAEDGTETMKLDFRVYGIQKSVRTVLRQAAAYFCYYARSILRSFVDLAIGRVGVNELSGPVGVVSAVNQAVQYGWRDVLALAALLAVNLGIFNLLPIPALDGCKLIFLAVEGVFGRAVPQRVQNAVNTAGMALLLWLMLFVTMQDISRFF